MLQSSFWNGSDMPTSGSKTNAINVSVQDKAEETEIQKSSVITNGKAISDQLEKY